jgi:hypothetical protein
MRRSTFSRQFTVSGVVRTVTGHIEVVMSYDNVVETGTHAVTHDDYSKSVPLHKIEVKIDNNAWTSIKDLRSEQAVLDNVQELVRMLKEELSSRANTIPAKTFEEKLNDILNS